jgi:hypothetical protein
MIALKEIEEQGPTTAECVRAFIKAKGKLELAAEDLDMEREDLALVLARNKAETYEAMEAVMLMSAFDTFTYMSTIVKGAIPAASPDTQIKAYVSMLSAIREFTSPKNNVGGGNTTLIGSMNVDQRILEALPPQDREAILTLIRQPAQLPENTQPVDASFSLADEATDESGLQQ